MAAQRKSKGAYMISAVAEMYEIHPQTLRLYEREGLLKPSRTDGQHPPLHRRRHRAPRVHSNLARDLGVNIAGIAIILQMRERMEEMNRQDAELRRGTCARNAGTLLSAAPGAGAIVPLRQAVGRHQIPRHQPQAVKARKCLPFQTR